MRRIFLILRVAALMVTTAVIAGCVKADVVFSDGGSFDDNNTSFYSGGTFISINSTFDDLEFGSIGQETDRRLVRNRPRGIVALALVRPRVSGFSGEYPPAKLLSLLV